MWWILSDVEMSVINMASFCGSDRQGDAIIFLGTMRRLL